MRYARSLRWASAVLATVVGAALVSAPPANAVKRRATPSTPPTVAPQGTASNTSTANLTAEFEGMPIADAAKRIFGKNFVDVQPFRDESGRLSDDIMWTTDRRKRSMFIQLLTAEKATGGASYEGRRVLQRTVITDTAYNMGRGASAPLGGNKTDGFYSVRMDFFISSGFKTPTKVSNPNGAAITAAPLTNSFAAAAKKTKTPNQVKVKVYNERMIKVGYYISTATFPKASPMSPIVRWQDYDATGKPISPGGSGTPGNVPMAGPVDAETGAAMRECQSMANDVGAGVTASVLGKATLVSGALIAAGTAVAGAGIAVGSSTAVTGVGAIGAAQIFELGAVMVAAGIAVALVGAGAEYVLSASASAAAYANCLETIPPPPIGKFPVPPFLPPGSGPNLGSPIEVCDRYAQVGAGGGNSSARTKAAAQGAPANPGPDVPNNAGEIDVIAGGDTTSACVDWHIEFV